MEEWKRFRDSFREISGRVNYTEGHLYLILLYTYKKGLTGRYYLKDKLELGEATIRNILNRMKKLGVIEALRGGHRLTRKGLEILESVMNKLLILNIETEIKPGQYTSIFIIRSAGDKVRTGIEERDDVIKYGGSGAVILVYRNGRIIFPDSGLEVENWYPKFPERLHEYIELREGDAILITGGETKEKALLSGINTSLNLLTKIK